MNTDGNETRGTWTAPKLVELRLGMKDVENSYKAGLDGENAGGNSDS